MVGVRVNVLVEVLVGTGVLVLVGVAGGVVRSIVMSSKYALIVTLLFVISANNLISANAAVAGETAVPVTCV